jgi:hypothetical protein
MMVPPAAAVHTERYRAPLRGTIGGPESPKVGGQNRRGGCLPANGRGTVSLASQVDADSINGRSSQA